EGLLIFGDPGLDALADFRIRRRGVFDSVQAHSRKARPDARVGTQETFLGKQTLALYGGKEIFEEPRRIWMQRFFGDTDRMNADDNGIGIRRPIDRRSLGPGVLDSMRSNNGDRKLTGD